jgi:MFS transporter, SP family, general alpha glucoside:H+ symporter
MKVIQQISTMASNRGVDKLHSQMKDLSRSGMGLPITTVALRGYLTICINTMWGVGQLLTTAVLRALLSRKDEWSYRTPFSLQWIWSVPLIIVIALAPESPRWLVRKDRYNEARKSLRRLAFAPSDAELDNAIAMLRHSDDIEKELVTGTSYLDCFKGINLRKSEIACRMGHSSSIRSFAHGVFGLLL